MTGHSTQIQKGKEGILLEVSVPSDFGLNNAEIKKMSIYQDLKNELKRSWKLKSAKIVPVINGAMGIDKEEPHKDPTNITTN